MELITASAGSGKTYTLAKKYIEILLDAYLSRQGDRMEFEHILAVTFTNKATAEMKERILNELYVLASDPVKSSYYADFSRRHSERAVANKEMWRAILLSLLHNYSRFSVSTIDAFFQRVLRNFARELGSYNSYRISLDRYSLVSEAAENILSSVSDEADPVYGIIRDMSEAKIAEGSRFDVKKDVVEIAQHLMGGEFVRMLDELFNHGHRTLKDTFYEGLRAHTRVFEQRVEGFKAALSKEMDVLYREIVSQAKILSDFFDKYSDNVNQNVLKAVKKCYEKRGRVGLSPSNVAKLLDGSVIKKGAAGSVSDEYEALKPVAENMLAQLEKAAPLGEIYKSVPHLQFAVRVFKEFDLLTAGENVKCLEETTQLLSDIINGSDVPFIYEKTGVQFVHYLLDEFQDTSHVQWSNFKPLLENAESIAGRNLVVGDAKQSIYRFRNSDHTILTREVPERFPNNLRTNLDTNFRSGRNIVEFNNMFFASLATTLDAELGGSVLRDIYLAKDADGNYAATLGQKAHRDFDGYVSYERMEKTDSVQITDEMTRCVVALVGNLKSKGVKPKDILVLVKGKKEAGDIAEALLADGHGVYSDDSLLVDSNPLARTLLGILRHIDNKNDEISAALASQYGRIDYSTLVDLCDTAIGKIKEKYSTSEEGVREFEGSIPYLSSVVDLVSDYQANYGNSLHGFLSYYDRQGRQIASSPSEDSVRIMTIHKSKGLAGEFVIVPFVQKIILWDARHNQKWSETDQGVSYGRIGGENAPDDFIYYASLKKETTAFKEAYAKERVARFVDGLNLLYVALTRPVHALFVLDGIVVNDGKDVYRTDSISKYVDIRYLGERGALDEAISDYSRRDNGLTDGTGRIQARYDVYDSSSMICNSFEAIDFFNKSEGTSGREKGIFCHDILSLIHTESDVEQAVAQKWQDEVLELDRRDLVAYFKEKLASVASYGWFSPSAQIIAEAELLVRIDSQIEVRRPDRVVIHPSGKVDIVDYKFGQEHSRKHHIQVASYCDFYRRLGYTDVSGYLWYVNENQVEKVEVPTEPVRLF